MSPEKYEDLVCQTVVLLKRVMEARDVFLRKVMDLPPLHLSTETEEEWLKPLVQNIEQWVTDIASLPLDEHYAFLTALPQKYAAILEQTAHPETIRREMLCYLREATETFWKMALSREYEHILAAPENSIKQQVLDGQPPYKGAILELDRALQLYLQQCGENIDRWRKLIDFYSTPTESPPQL